MSGTFYLVRQWPTWRTSYTNSFILSLVRTLIILFERFSILNLKNGPYKRRRTKVQWTASLLSAGSGVFLWRRSSESVAVHYGSFNGLKTAREQYYNNFCLTTLLFNKWTFLFRFSTSVFEHLTLSDGSNIQHYFETFDIRTSIHFLLFFCV